MKLIEQDFEQDIICDSVKNGTNLLLTHGFGDEFILDKQGAKHLIEVLKEFVDNEYN